MNEVWELKKLEEICEVITKGTTPTSVGFEFMDQGVNFIKVESLTESGIIIPEKVAHISEECHQTLKRSQLKVNDILFSIAGALGRIGIVNKEILPANTNQALAIIRLKNDSGISVRFLSLFFISGVIANEIKNLKGGVAQQNLSLGQLSNLVIPVPHPAEQRQIVTILNETFAAIERAKENTERNQQNAKELFDSYLAAVFTNKDQDWEEKKLSDIALQFGRGKSRHRPRNDQRLYGGSYPFIQTGDVRNADKFITSYSQTYNEIGLAQSKLWPKGTICITIAANIAETGIIDFDSCFPDSMIGLNVDPQKADTDYTYYVLQFLKAELKLQGKGSAQDNINLGTFENQKFPFPSLTTQKTLVQKLDALSEECKKLEANYQKKLDDLEELKKVILQKAFNGELKTSDVAV